MLRDMPAVRQFDESQALRGAMQAFWAHGFEATSMSELVEAMDMNRGSIYATFGDKRSLFLGALKHYDRVHREAWLTRIAARCEPRAAIIQVFEGAVDAALGRSSDGCFLVNTALELAAHDEEVREVVADSLRSAESFFAVMLEADGRDRRLAPALLSMFVGVRVLARCRPERALLRGIVAQVEALLP